MVDIFDPGYGGDEGVKMSPDADGRDVKGAGAGFASGSRAAADRSGVDWVVRKREWLPHSKG
jgi:hypothetical protein